jgi:hypothetical protein
VRPMMTKGGRTGKHGRRSGSALSEGLGITRVRARQGRAGPTIQEAPDKLTVDLGGETRLYAKRSRHGRGTRRRHTA